MPIRWYQGTNFRGRKGKRKNINRNLSEKQANNFFKRKRTKEQIYLGTSQEPPYMHLSKIATLPAMVPNKKHLFQLIWENKL